MPFHPSLTRGIRLCRYTVYIALGIWQVVVASIQLTPLPVWLAGLAICPALIHLTLQTSRRSVYVAHVIEAAGLNAVLFVLHASPLLHLSYSAVIIACNAALFGWRCLPVLAAVLASLGVLATAIWQQGLAPLPLLLEYLFAGLAAATMIIVAAVANGQAWRHIAGRRRQYLRHARLARYVPDDLARRVADDAAPLASRQWLTIAFIDLVGFSRATDELPAEALAELLNDFLGTAAAEVERAGGIINKFLGDGLLCIFVAEHREARARVASQCVRQLERLPGLVQNLNGKWTHWGLPGGMQVTIGVASGYCTLGDWGGQQRLDYTVVGTPVNLASRLQTHATAGSLLMDEVTAKLVAPALALAPPLAIQPKGMAETRAYTPLPA